MQFLNGKKIWLFLMVVALMISTFYVWQTGQKERKVYAGGRVVEKVTPEILRLKVSWVERAG